ncbi:MAG: hypothetical protein ABIH46_11555 [Chloroflexota bacterium]
MRQTSSTGSKKRAGPDIEWALKIQKRVAVPKYYRKLWPRAEIFELDAMRKNELAKSIDVGGADKMVKLPDGQLIFLGQRFRRWDSAKKYDDFTLRATRHSGMLTEFEKILLALTRGGFMAGFFAYGHVNKVEDDFLRFRILRLREFCEAVMAGHFNPKMKDNTDGSSNFLAMPMELIPVEFFEVNYIGMGQASLGL